MWPLKGKTKTAYSKRGVKQAQSLKRRRRLSIFIRGASLTAVCCAGVAGVYIWKAGLAEEWMTEARDTVDREIAGAGFMIGEIRITGQHHTSLKQIRVALALYDGQSIVSLDLDNMLKQVEALPWVKAATIIRLMPDVLDVHITEHEAAALWQESAKFFLVNRGGEIITEENLGEFSSLPQVVGVGANENLASLLAMKTKYPDLFVRVKSAVWIGQRRWDLNLHNGIKVKLPEKGPEVAWQILHDYAQKQKILAKEILIVDLRQYGKTIIRLTPKEAERRRIMVEMGNKEESI